MWGFFNAKVPETAPNRNVIIDLGMEHVIDDEFMNTGVREGWLELSGWYQRNGVTTHTYRHIG